MAMHRTGEINPACTETLFIEKGRYLTQSCDKSPYTDRKNPKCNVTTQKMPPKTWITKRFWTDLGPSVRVMIDTKLVWLNRFTGPNLPTNRNRCVIKRTHVK